MKKFILSSAIILALFSSAFANHSENFKRNAQAAFQKDFIQVSDVSWAETPNFLRVTFHMDKQTLMAYYDYQGKLVGLVHNMLTTSLPKDLQEDIKKCYSKYWVSELFQVTYEEGTYYYIELKNADETIVLTTEGTNGWHKYTKLKTNVNL